MIVKHTVKSCCGNKAYIFETQKPIKKDHLDSFRNVGYTVPQQFINVGIFYVKKDGLIATTSFGSTRFQVRCASKNADDLLKDFEYLLDAVVS